MNITVGGAVHKEALMSLHYHQSQPNTHELNYIQLHFNVQHMFKSTQYNLLVELYNICV